MRARLGWSARVREALENDGFRLWSSPSVDGSLVLPGVFMPVADLLTLDAVVSVVHGIHREITAEFVQNDQTLDLLRARGVGFAQGHHIAEPHPVPELARTAESAHRQPGPAPGGSLDVRPGEEGPSGRPPRRLVVRGGIAPGLSRRYPGGSRSARSADRRTLPASSRRGPSTSSTVRGTL